MNKYFGIFRVRRIAALITFSLLGLFIYTSSAAVAFGQKKPPSLRLDAEVDEKMLCADGTKLSKSQFCDLWTDYKNALAANNATAARNARNDMIEIVRGQVDTYYKLRKDGRRFKTKVFQQILDFLEIGGALTIAIMNGTRAKSIVGAAIGALQGGRTSYNKNFDLLETQVLINKMNTNRALVYTEILENIDKPVRAEQASKAYSWYAAKNDLRRYFLAGTYDNALDTLIRQTGAAVETAEAQLRVVEERPIRGESTPQQNKETADYNTTLTVIERDLADAATQQVATDKLRKVLAELVKDVGFKTFLDAQVTNSSSGAQIAAAIRQLIAKADIDGDEAAIKKIQSAIVIFGN